MVFCNVHLSGEYLGRKRKNVFRLLNNVNLEMI
jgi:hypothetical protein